MIRHSSKINSIIRQFGNLPAVRHGLIIFTGLLTYCILALFPSPVLAALNNPPQITDLEEIFATLVQAAVGMGGLALLFTLLTGGYNWATAGGDTKKLSQAQLTITFALIGFVLFMAAVLILRLITEFTGINVLNFRVNV